MPATPGCGGSSRTGGRSSGRSPTRCSRTVRTRPAAMAYRAGCARRSGTVHASCHGPSASRCTGTPPDAREAGVFLPFDPDEVMLNFWAERYVTRGGPGVRQRAYYAVRPLLPRRVQIALRRLYSRVQRRTPFPRWPVEESLHGFVDRLLGWAADVAGEPVPYLAPWPAGRSWAFVPTHDV